VKGSLTTIRNTKSGVGAVDNAAGSTKSATEVIQNSQKTEVMLDFDNVASASANFMDDAGKKFYANAQYLDQDSFYDVIAHGTPTQIQIQTSKGPTLVDHRVAAKLIEQQPDYNGQNIRLISCSTGACADGFAQNLANTLGVTVRAPSDTLWVFPNGAATIGPKPNTHTGQWIDFTPQNKNP
jgi:hypothetical protein